MGPKVNDNPPNEDPDYPGKTLDEAVNMNTFTISDSEEENDEEPTDYGYQLLPQEPFEETPVSASDETNEVSTCEDAVSNAEEAPQQDESAVERDRLVLDSANIETIKASMVGFSLPASSIPAWANEIPEEQWKSRLSSLITSARGGGCLNVEAAKEDEGR